MAWRELKSLEMGLGEEIVIMIIVVCVCVQRELNRTVRGEQGQPGSYPPCWPLQETGCEPQPKTWNGRGWNCKENPAAEGIYRKNDRETILR